MPRVTKREAARRDLIEHFVYLAEEAGPDVAERFLANAEASFNDLANLRKWRIKGFDNHLVFYEPRPGGVSIVRVLHAARDWWGLLGYTD